MSAPTNAEDVGSRLLRAAMQHVLKAAAAADAKKQTIDLGRARGHVIPGNEYLELRSALRHLESAMETVLGAA